MRSSSWGKKERGRQIIKKTKKWKQNVESIREEARVFLCLTRLVRKLLVGTPCKTAPETYDSENPVSGGGRRRRYLVTIISTKPPLRPIQGTWLQPILRCMSNLFANPRFYTHFPVSHQPIESGQMICGMWMTVQVVHHHDNISLV